MLIYFLVLPSLMAAECDWLTHDSFICFHWDADDPNHVSATWGGEARARWTVREGHYTVEIPAPPVNYFPLQSTVYEPNTIEIHWIDRHIADLNIDGQVDGKDYAIFAKYWLMGIESQPLMMLAENRDVYFKVSGTGKYHRLDCRYVEMYGDDWKLIKESEIENHHIPCKVCKPDEEN